MSLATQALRGESPAPDDGADATTKAVRLRPTWCSLVLAVVTVVAIPGVPYGIVCCLPIWSYVSLALAAIGGCIAFFAELAAVGLWFSIEKAGWVLDTALTRSARRLCAFNAGMTLLGYSISAYLTWIGEFSFLPLGQPFSYFSGYSGSPWTLAETSGLHAAAYSMALSLGLSLATGLGILLWKLVSSAVFSIARFYENRLGPNCGLELFRGQARG